MFFTKEQIQEQLKKNAERMAAGQPVDKAEEETLLRLEKLIIRERAGQPPEQRKIDEEHKKKRGWRNKVDLLELDYEDYRKTKLWKQIKTRVLLRDNHCCKRCGGRAEHVHHISYDPSVMLGQDDSKLVSLCSGCHEIVHFNSGGMKRSPEGQLVALSDLSLNEAMPKVDMRRTRRYSALWSRLTAIQKAAYLNEFNQRRRESLAKRSGS